MIIIQLIIVIICCFIIEKAETVTISLRNTKIIGQIKQWNNKQVAMFLGIPYAQPPIGQLRFKEPKPIAKWPKVIRALELPVACMQLPIPGFPIIKLGRNSQVSEDCLYLNIWSPISGNNKLKTVMIWIHGGGSVLGSSNEPTYESTVLSAMGDVVVVTLNYRLGIFGFLYTGTDVGPGNMAVLDQTLAFKWIKTNIEKFGGDPNKITLIGWSAGSIFTSAHLLSPVTRDLFENAIMMSGAALGFTAIQEQEVALDYWNSAAKLVNCTDNEFIGLNKTLSPIVIDCLQKTPASELIKTNLSPLIAKGYITYQPYLVVDKLLFPQTTRKMIERRNFKKNVNLLITNPSDEGSIFFPLLVDPIKFNKTNPYNFTYSEAYNELKRISATFPIGKDINTEDISKLYFTGLSDNSDPDLLRETIGIAFGDFVVTCPEILFARALFEKDPNNVKVYELLFNSKLGVEKLDCSKWMGVCHGNDLWFLFGLPFTHSNTSLNREKQISAQMIKIFTEFAKTGKTTAQNGEQWYSFYQINNITTAPYYEITNDEKTSNVKTGLKINECLNLWKYYIY